MAAGIEPVEVAAESRDRIYIETDGGDEVSTFPLSVDVKHLEIRDITATIHLEELIRSTTVVACSSVDHFAQA